MNFSLSDEHVLLRDSAHDFLRKETDLSPLLVPGATVDQAGYGPMWDKMAALGWAGLVIPEAHGGLGMTAIDLAMIVRECGRFLAPAPLFGTLAGTWALLAAGTQAQKARCLPEVASGNLRLALAVADRQGETGQANADMAVVRADGGYRLTGQAFYVVDAAAADRIVVAALLGGARRCFMVDRTAPGLAVRLLEWRDITRQVCALELAEVPAELLGEPESGADVWPWVRDRLYLVLAAESAGGLQAVLDDTSAYARERVAFGRPIGYYQAIKHTLADMLSQSECAWTAVLYAAWALSVDDEAGPVAAAMAQAYASEAYRDASHRGIQVFGAIGFTWEMKNHLYFKRARGNATLLGAPWQQREFIARVLETRAANTLPATNNG